MASKNQPGDGATAYTLTVSDGAVSTIGGSGVIYGSGGSGGIGGVTYDNTIYWDNGANVSAGDMQFRVHVCQGGHTMANEQVLEDGTVLGSCTVCGDVITGRRMPGGLVLERLLALVEGIMASQDELAAEILDAERALQAERSSLEQAERVLGLAKQLLVR